MKFPNWPNHNGINKINIGLERISALLEKLDNPQNKLPLIFHIAGTNGKGSTSAFLKSILEKNNYKVHRYTSPHIVRFNERIEICGEEITDDYYNELAEECKNVIEKNNLEVSYFEIITTIAFMAFSRQKADAVILEVGLGGRLDATNIINESLVDIITPISLDHTSILGDTLEKIAIEKIAIAKNNSSIIISQQEKCVIKIIEEELDKKNTNKTYFLDKEYSFKKINDEECEFIGFSKKFNTKLPSLEGDHQIINAGTAIASILCQNKINIDISTISNAVNNTFWKARLQNLQKTKLYNLVKKNSELYLDGSHNEGGATVIKNWIYEKNKIDKRENVLILSMLERKNVKSYINIIKNSFDKIIIVSSDTPSSNNDKYKSIADFKKEFKNINIEIFFSCDNITTALKKTNDIQSDKNLRILICGSLYFCGDVLSLVENY